MSFKKYILLKEAEQQSNTGQPTKDWRKEFIQLEKGFIPPSKLRPIIEAFLKSNEVPIQKDTSKGHLTMDKKPLFLVGGPVRDFLKGKSIKDYDLATPATPEQIAQILHFAGFTMSPERAGKEGQELDLSFKPKLSKPGDKKVWYVKGRDNSPENKPFVIGAVVDGEEFDLATFRRDAKVTDGAAAVDFVDNPVEDASRRDLTINAMYIELSKPDGENSKLYDPTGKGWHDVKNGHVRTVGKAEDRFQEDKLRVMRAIRFHCRFGKGSKLDPDIERAIPRFRNLQGVALERVRDEFVKGLIHPEVDPKCYLSIYSKTGLLDKVFPGVKIRGDIPTHFRDRRDKLLALAWILQDNSIEEVSQVLGRTRKVGEDEAPTGWANQERNAVLYLLTLKDFDVENLDNFLDHRQGTGLSDDQLRDWIEMFKFNDGAGRFRHQRPQWAKLVSTFVDFKPDIRDKVTWNEKIPCPGCTGPECASCAGKGYLKGAVHPEIISRGLHAVPITQRSGVVKDLNKEKLKSLFGNLMPKNE